MDSNEGENISKGESKEMTTSQELQDAIDSYIDGNKESFNEIYEQSYRYLYTCVIHVVKDEETAMDMLQETYLEISKSLNQLNNTAGFLNWAATIANRKCFAYLKKQKDIVLSNTYDENNNSDSDSNTDFFESIPDNEEFIPESILQDKEKQRLIKEILDSLTDIQRLCVIGYYYNEQKQEEIAEELNIPVNTVKSHLSRAKAKIKEAVIELDEKKGTRLYSLAPFMAMLFSMEAEACEKTPPNFSSEELSLKENNIVSGTEKAKEISRAFKTKIIIGTVIGGLAIMGTIIGISASNNEEPVSQMVEQSSNEEQTPTESESFESISESEVESIIESTEKQTEEILEISGYESYGFAFGGVIPVKKDGLWGAINYQNEEIVPCQYSGLYASPNNKGYFVLTNSRFEEQSLELMGEVQTWETEYKTYYLFDPTGKIIYEGEDEVMASGNVYEKIVYTGDESMNLGYVEYYNYDGNLILTTENIDGLALKTNGFYDGEATVYQGKYLSDDDVMIELRLGSLHEDGTVTWDDNPFYSGASYGTGEITVTEDNGYADNAGSMTGAWAYIPKTPLNSINNGYYVMQNPYMENGNMELYNDKNELIAQWNVYTIKESDNGFIVPDELYYNEENWPKNFFHDGDWYYNYGSKMVWEIGEKDVLVDLTLVPGMTTDTMSPEIILATYDMICMSNEKYWLVQQGEQWGYIDHEGNIMGMYEDASDFHEGKALIIEEGKAYMIDESFNKIEEIGTADGVRTYGEMFRITTEEEDKFILSE